MDREKLKQAAALILEAIGQDGRDGTKETPERFAKMMEERLAYAGVSNEEIAKEFDKVFPCDDGNMVVVKDIDVFSFCEHHIALMYDTENRHRLYPQGLRSSACRSWPASPTPSAGAFSSRSASAPIYTTCCGASSRLTTSSSAFRVSIPA